MNGQQLYQAVQTMYSNFGIDPTLFLQFVNVARIIREGMRPWRRLTKLANTQLVTPAVTWKTPLNLPSDFEFLTKDGLIVLFDGNDTYQELEEVPWTDVIQYKDWSNRFVVDHANLLFYVLGIVDKNYNAWIHYQADYGDITLTTQWMNIPTRYHMMLAFDALCMYEMGVDYDDIQARNANKLNQIADTLYNAMCKWDDNLQRSATTRVDYGHSADSNSFISNKINVNGAA